MNQKLSTKTIKSIRIAIFSNTLLSGGAERQALILAKNLKDYYQVILVIYYGDKAENRHVKMIEDHNIEAILLKGNHFTKTLSLFKILKQKRINIIFSYLLTTNFLGAIVGRLARVDYCIGGIRNAILSKNKLPVQRFLHNRMSSHTIFNNHRGFVTLSKAGFKIEKATIIPNCLDSIPELIIRDNNEIVNIITVGRFIRQKGFDIAIDTIRMLVKRQCKVKYAIVGYGKLEHTIKEQIENSNLTEVIDLIIDPAELSELYRSADIYLCTSRFEGLSNTIMEAMSYSLPIIASNVGDNSHLVMNNENGFLVEDLQPNMFINPLLDLIHSSELRVEYGRAGYTLLKDQFGEHRFRRRYLDFIQKLGHSKIRNTAIGNFLKTF